MPTTHAADLYEILGAGRQATTEEIESAYRRLAHATHPDKGGNAALFRLLTEARETLRDPARRASYDAATSQPDYGTQDSPDGGSPGDAWQPEAGDASGEPRRARWWSRLDPVARRTALVTAAVNVLGVFLGHDFVPLVATLLGAAIIARSATDEGWGWPSRITLFVAVAIGLFLTGYVLYLAAMVAFALMAVLLALAIFVPSARSAMRWIAGLFIGSRPQPGEVWYADFPFEEDASESKDRPCLLLAVEDGQYVTCKITSVDHSDRPGYHPVMPAVTGLPKLSYIRVTPPVMLTRQQLRRCVGEADPVLWAWAAQRNARAS